MHRCRFWLALGLGLAVVLTSSPPGHAATTGSSPSLAVYRDQLYLAFQSADRERHIHIARVSKDGTIARSARLGSRTSRGPVLAAYEDRLWMAFRSADRSGHIYVQRFDGEAWSRPKKLRFKTRSSPALAAHGGRLHLVWRGASNDSMYHASYDGNAWSDSIKMHLTSKGPPTLASYGNRLILLYRVGDDQNVFAAHWTAKGWRDGPGARKGVRQLLNTARRVSVAPHDGRLVAALIPRGTSQILLRSYAGGGGWTPEPDPDVKSSKRVGMASFRGGLYMALTRKSGAIRVERIER